MSALLRFVRRHSLTVFYVLLVAGLVVAALFCLAALAVTDSTPTPPTGGPGYGPEF